ncbi:MAG: hypothetical protein ACHQKY_14320 [Terriglobia bacterium]
MPDEIPKPATPPSPAPPSATPVAKPAAAVHAAPPAAPKKKKAEGIQVKKPGQWVCLVKDEKGKNCEGKLKRYYDLDETLVRQVGKNAELYRCVECHSLYRPEDVKHDPAATWAQM